MVTQANEVKFKLLIMKKILVPIDYSPTAANALDYALAYAKSFDASVLLLHVFHIPVATAEAVDVQFTLSGMQEQHEDRMKKFVREMDKHKAFGVIVETLVMPGFAVSEITAVAEEKKAELIIMGITGAGTLGEVIFGSTAIGVMRNTKVPMMIIPPQAKFTGFEKITFAYDYKHPVPQGVTAYLKKIVKENTELKVLNIHKGEAENKVATAVHGALLEHTMEMDGIPHELCFIEDDNIIHGINSFNRQNKTDLLVMVPHRHNFLELILQQSLTKKMAFHGTTPILVLH